MIESVNWKDSAACRQEDFNHWFPEYSGPSEVRKAKQICLSCPVINQCLEYAINHEEHYGVWGGMTPRERSAVVSNLRRGRVKLPIYR